MDKQVHEEKPGLTRKRKKRQGKKSKQRSFQRFNERQNKQLAEQFYKSIEEKYGLNSFEETRPPVVREVHRAVNRCDLEARLNLPKIDLSKSIDFSDFMELMGDFTPITSVPAYAACFGPIAPVTRKCIVPCDLSKTFEMDQVAESDLQDVSATVEQSCEVSIDECTQNQFASTLMAPVEKTPVDAPNEQHPPVETSIAVTLNPLADEFVPACSTSIHLLPVESSNVAVRETPDESVKTSASPPTVVFSYGILAHPVKPSVLHQRCQRTHFFLGWLKRLSGRQLQLKFKDHTYLVAYYDLGKESGFVILEPAE